MRTQWVHTVSTGGSAGGLIGKPSSRRDLTCANLISGCGPRAGFSVSGRGTGAATAFCGGLLDVVRISIGVISLVVISVDVIRALVLTGRVSVAISIAASVTVNVTVSTAAVAVLLLGLDLRCPLCGIGAVDLALLSERGGDR